MNDIPGNRSSTAGNHNFFATAANTTHLVVFFLNLLFAVFYSIHTSDGNALRNQRCCGRSTNVNATQVNDVSRIARLGDHPLRIICTMPLPFCFVYISSMMRRGRQI